MFVIFQIGLLENFYRSRKIRKTSSLIAEVKEIINNQDFNCELGIINENIVSQIEQISVSEETAVYIISEPLTKDDEKVNFRFSFDSTFTFLYSCNSSRLGGRCKWQRKYNRELP